MKIKILNYTILVLSLVLLTSCNSARSLEKPLVPAIEYSRRVNNQPGSRSNAHEMVQERYEETVLGQKGSRSRLDSLQQGYGEDARASESSYDQFEARAGLDPRASANSLNSYHPTQFNKREYKESLSLGDPGQQSSLWRETGSATDFFRDVRAWQPLDLITINIIENTEGKKEADTEVKSQSGIKAAISNLLGFDADFISSNPNADLSSLIAAETKNDFKGEGETTRKDSLKGSISAMVVEVLPTGILRIEGTKIISVNNEEQIMVLTGLVRPRDITSENIVDSSRLANMRIDYYGRGEIGDAQRQGWLGRSLRTIWPF